MAKHKFENHEGELENPVIEKLSASYSLGSEQVKIFATLTANGSSLYGVDLGEMPNTSNWTDADVMAWAENKLQDYEI